MRGAWHERQRRIKESLKGTYLYRLLGERLFTRYVWVHDRRAISGGLAVGVFVALTPTIPLQMFLAALGALRWKVNLVVALAACWITNPLTAVPIYVVAWRLGRFILEDAAFFESLFDIYSFESSIRFGAMFRQSAYLWTGSIIMASGASLFAYVAVHLLWVLAGKVAPHKNDTPSPGPDNPPP